MCEHRVEELSGKLVPFWTPPTATAPVRDPGGGEFGESTVSLAMGHASLRMTEHYVERNLKAVFEKMAERG